ncbi:uncharacterized protein B0H18DRAFT_1060849 [Fomitopsis serialis]|uniref:uncharacterized protein n=1 Tax=Fomitopsis serialis TaxID=139415 RepID=UPI0020074527|nr:uncharacterized protein B0H18DRAFT_1060849 [Neoantrodia serialis]KAH9911631.1 hypothetical protein B0H18DRAFT_1060849 [Neoantrodia serialis]
MTVDAMVLLAMWQTIGGFRKLAEGLRANVSLTRRLLRDGTLYFFVLLLMNAIVLALYILPTDFAGKNMASLPDIATSVILSRLFLNLREAVISSPTSQNTSESPSQLSDLHFSRVLGALGSSATDGCGAEDSGVFGEPAEADANEDELVTEDDAEAMELRVVLPSSSNGPPGAVASSQSGRGASSGENQLFALLERIA